MMDINPFAFLDTDICNKVIVRHYGISITNMISFFFNCESVDVGAASI